MRWLALFFVIFSMGVVAQEMDWTTFLDSAFRFDYPKSWKITTATSPVMHYRQVHVALNNFGRERFQVIDFNTGPGTYEYGSVSTLKQLPAGAVYLDVATWEGPPLPRDFKVEDTPAAELAAQMAKDPVPDRDDQELRASTVDFNKGGRRWSIFVYERAPFLEANRSLVRHILASMEFEPTKK